ncbi:coenzyme F420 hydrogenase [Proteus sp. G2618]|uniref:Coenzyme F420 hydrogenase/dehydrogenase, beta subunit C-terminal domain n=1 Tax=Proteus sp. G2618 TaxID=2698841 RepID=UPI0013790CA2|nr:Coenzyme F420 hydrogenase/dehydrogenase, beta subunit C-terminal domain [Proteus sp. G2618]NBN70026.1 coenzyme F420 hydrogenase [Proteus sp. G2618]
MNVKEFNSKKVFSEVSGVTSLVENKIKIKMNDKGLYEEVIGDTEDTELSLIVEKVSPYLNKDINENVISNKLYSNQEGCLYDKRIGYYISLYAGHVLEGDYRRNASSGGVGTWILKELLENNYIDGVIHVKEKNDSDSSILFEYQISKSIKEIKEGAKTKYYPVELSKVLEVVKENAGKYAIVGIPSFIKAVRLLCQEEPIFNDRIIFTVGLICGHQKSTKFADFMGWQVGIQPGDMKNIDFRYKLDDFPADKYAIKMTGLINGEMKTVIVPKNKLHGQNWGLGYFKPIASDFTDDVFNETADIVIGDAWLPEYSKDSLGNNIVIVRNNVIHKIIQNAIKDKRVNFQSIDTNKIFQSQAAHYRHTHDELSYRLFKLNKKGKWYPHLRVKPENNISFLRGLVQDMRIKIASKSHSYYEEAVKMNDIDYFISNMEKINRKYKILYTCMAIQNKGIKGLVKYLINKIVK